MMYLTLSYILSIIVAFILVPNEMTFSISLMFIFLGLFIYSMLSYFLILVKEFVLKEELKYQTFREMKELEDDEDESNETDSK